LSNIHRLVNLSSLALFFVEYLSIFNLHPTTSNCFFFFCIVLCLEIAFISKIIIN
jgi:hypothetical protein